MDMDDYSDDGFDDLNDNVLQELENNAIQFTQAKLAQSQVQVPLPSQQQRPQHTRQPPQLQQQQQQQRRQQAAYEYSFDDNDLDDTVVIDDHAQQAQPPPRPNAAAEAKAKAQAQAQVHQHVSLVGQQHRWNQSRPQYPRQTPTYPPRPQFPVPSRPAPPPLPSQRYPTRPGVQSRLSQPPQSQFTRPALPAARPYPGLPSQAIQGAGGGKPNEILSALQARLSALEAELTAAKGEAAIVRSKYEKSQVTHDAEVARLKKQTAEQLAKQEQAVEDARAAERAAETELRFARQDIQEGLGRNKARKKDGITTPKKSKKWDLGDGFDSNEILSSPSKGLAQKRKDQAHPTIAGPSLERTPTKGKRKRPAVDSPSFALETHSEDLVLEDAPAAPESGIIAKVRTNELPFDFLRLVLDYSPLHGQPLTFDLFARFAFPSDPSQTFASMIFQKLPQMGTPKEPLRLLIDFAELMIDTWQQCLSEKYHAPIYYLAALITYTLQLNTIAVAPHIISSLVPVCTTTCSLVALPRFNSENGDMSSHSDSVVRQLYLDIDVTQCLSLLNTSALGCLSPLSAQSGIALPLDYSPQVAFWKGMDLEFVMVMLSPKHPEADWFGMLALLWTSVLPDSIGPISNPVSSTTHFTNGRAERETPQFVAGGIIERVSSYLQDPPSWATPGTAKEIRVRLAVLKTLMVFATSPFGFMCLASNQVVIPRLVTVLCWAMDHLYDMDLPPGSNIIPAPNVNVDESTTMYGDSMEIEELGAGFPQEKQEEYKTKVGRLNSDYFPASSDDDGYEETFPLLYQLITRATLLLHTLITNPRTANVVNVAAKLAASLGGAQRYLLTLARLSFADDDLVLEAGIEAETSEFAHELLELAVTPDEGEGVGELFGLVRPGG
ncbi:hypothetical protein B0T22DRAFT_460487 [Podospora appendiculata]|uniref:DNA repair protein Rad26 n=1 Tax=Podospora appendiculata TaxID=314037 RepID=A0AAE0XA74_9PEZI|nr:hypothetical protein B0T22DRAFT_460487 [Podospora appendiculata]